MSISRHKRGAAMWAKAADCGGGAPELECHGREFIAKARRCACEGHFFFECGTKPAVSAQGPNPAEKHM